MQQNPCGKCCVGNVIYNEKGRKTEKCRNKYHCLYGTLFGTKDSERKILENEKSKNENSRVHCNTHKSGMLPLETKQSGGKLLPQSDLWGGVFLGGGHHTAKGDLLLGTRNVRSLYRAGSLTAKARELARYK
jgi:hypothetical protein